MTKKRFVDEKTKTPRTSPCNITEYFNHHAKNQPSICPASENLQNVSLKNELENECRYATLELD